jgi:hypothetical protein
MNLKNYKKISAILLLFVMLIPLQLHAKISKKIKTIALISAYADLTMPEVGNDSKGSRRYFSKNLKQNLDLEKVTLEDKTFLRDFLLVISEEFKRSIPNRWVDTSDLVNREYYRNYPQSQSLNKRIGKKWIELENVTVSLGDLKVFKGLTKKDIKLICQKLDVDAIAVIKLQYFNSLGKVASVESEVSLAIYNSKGKRIVDFEDYGADVEGKINPMAGLKRVLTASPPKHPESYFTLSDELSSERIKIAREVSEKRIIRRLNKVVHRSKLNVVPVF